MAKVKTTKIGGGADYAKVADRILEFRNANPRGLIETTPSFLEDGSLMFKARILKDKSDEFSAEAIGHSLKKQKIGENGKVVDEIKYFEKQESIAVGRALALLGYGASGEIASSDEMEEFEEHKENQRLELIESTLEEIGAIESLEALSTYWQSITNVKIKADPKVIDAKNLKKQQLSEVKPKKK